MTLRILVALMIAVVLAACASKSLREDEARVFFAHAGEPVREIRAFRLTQWRALDREHLVVWRSMNDAYLLTVQGPCANLEFAQTIGIEYRAPVLRTRFDSVRVEGYSCPIESIRPIDYRGVRAELRALRD